jgi:hypothetical protein
LDDQKGVRITAFPMLPSLPMKIFGAIAGMRSTATVE